MLLGDVASVAAASHASNTPQQVGHSKPPLSRRPRPLSRAPKQRERDVPDVDWDGALQHFSVCVSQDLQDLNERFVKENVITFTAWKRLWREMNTSAAFHVEFWESTPTSTHKTILQQALDGLVSCIEQNGEFEDADDVASLIGRVFAIYCAYSLQLGVPKHKIDVDPEAWTALLSINCVMIGVGVTLFPSAVREVRAMMHRLAFQENAFLGCLQGFGSSVRVTDRLAVSRERSRTHQDSLPASSTQDTPVQRVDVEQLKILSDRKANEKRLNYEPSVRELMGYLFDC
ncbi:hypothetical protein BBO99_00005381 [Phytophthora kernoviae]|uniref:Uncharacterized protein n=2 Tax=Phytophthora kernoviae TaxID=325452 RepID=A0A3R7NFK7_9STRA|nr:hypothetical protein G195_009723 [Phytophthora kernoviae 00238/432]KAG2524039.1 hypothetical protein JM16_005138 [Phytophthora kernoviae]KAG2525941.1 hypothetical protein JM18_004633 [Phytophthora kernoviae]RLN37222.1 hypothetical protein BBI17_005325 [Phytophthora kernoviae]RLN79296.1 hypothetical protein BBO99_00005381 [Phytophthora kernoviae]